MKNTTNANAAHAAMPAAIASRMPRWKRVRGTTVGSQAAGASCGEIVMPLLMSRMGPVTR